MEAFQFFNFFKQRLCIFCQKLSNENKQRLYKIQKSLTSLFYHVLLIKQNECTPIWIGLTDLPNIGGASGPLAPPVPASPYRYYCIQMTFTTVTEDFQASLKIFFKKWPDRRLRVCVLLATAERNLFTFISFSFCLLTFGPVASSAFHKCIVKKYLSVWYILF